MSRISVLLMGAALATPALVLAQEAGPVVRPVLVQGAMAIEVERLVGRFDHPGVERVGGFQVLKAYVGTLKR